MLVPEAVESPQLRATLRGHADGVSKVAVSPDGRTLASACTQGGEVKLWDMAARKELATLKSDLGDYLTLAFAPDGRTLAIGSWLYSKGEQRRLTGGIGLWDVATGRQQAVLQHTPPRGVTGLVFSPDGKTLAASEFWQEDGTSESKRSVTLWDVTSGKVRDALPDEVCTSIAFAPDGMTLARAVYVVKDNQVDAIEVRCRDIATGRELPPLANTVNKNPINTLAYSPDGRTLAGADYRSTVILWDTATTSVRSTLRHEDDRRILSLAFSPDGKTLAVAERAPQDHEPGLIVLWDMATGQRLAGLTGHTSEVYSIAFSPDGRILASGGRDKTVRLWDVTDQSSAKVPAGKK